MPCTTKVEGEGKTDRKERGEENEREVWGFFGGSSGSRAINISCKAGKAGLAIFRKAKGCESATFNGRRPEIQIAAERESNCESRGYAYYILLYSHPLRDERRGRRGRCLRHHLIEFYIDTPFILLSVYRH